MREFDVSIIVPVYNAAPYLDECINSIREQTYPHLQIILINDGSTDASEEICRRHAIEDDRILVCTQTNQGLVATRNRGISLATGRYISFVDADDYLEKEIIECAVRCAEAENSELVCWNVAYVKDGEVHPEAAFGRPLESAAEVFAAIVAERVCPARLGPYFRAVWGKLFDADVIRNNKLCFTEIHYSEDAIFLLNYILHCKTIRLLQNHGYFYRYVSTSIVHSFHGDFLQANLLQMKLIQEAQDKWGLVSNVLALDAIQVYGWMTFNEMLENSLHGWKKGSLTYRDVYCDCSMWFRENHSLLTRKTDCSHFPKFAKIHVAGTLPKPLWYHCVLARLLTLYRKFK